jgi:predicted nucleotidyltransferase
MSTASTLDHLALSAAAWERRLRADRELIERLMPDALRDLHGVVVARARQVGARALILSGSTARGRRTEMSDLDYHLVGKRIATRDLSFELDLHVLSAEEIRTEILDGDDFIQWSLRFGRIAFDDGTLLEATRLMAEHRPWPAIERKRDHAAKSLELARRVVESGDQDGALVQVRTGLSLAARAYLLSKGEFPMSRAELPGQLLAAGETGAARALQACIEGEPPLEVLGAAVLAGATLLERA